MRFQSGRCNLHERSALPRRSIQVRTMRAIRRQIVQSKRSFADEVSKRVAGSCCSRACCHQIQMSNTEGTMLPKLRKCDISHPGRYAFGQDGERCACFKTANIFRVIGPGVLHTSLSVPRCTTGASHVCRQDVCNTRFLNALMTVQLNTLMTRRMLQYHAATDSCMRVRLQYDVLHCQWQAPCCSRSL